MAKVRHTTEQIISKLREAEVELAKGRKVPKVCKKLAVTEQTCYRWRKEYPGLRMDRARRLKEFERENVLATHEIGCKAGRPVSCVGRWNHDRH